MFWLGGLVVLRNLCVVFEPGNFDQKKNIENLKGETGEWRNFFLDILQLNPKRQPGKIWGTNQIPPKCISEPYSLGIFFDRVFHDISFSQFAVLFKVTFSPKYVSPDHRNQKCFMSSWWVTTGRRSGPQGLPSLKLTLFAPENGCLEYYCSFLFVAWPLRFRGELLFECTQTEKATFVDFGRCWCRSSLMRARMHHPIQKESHLLTKPPWLLGFQNEKKSRGAHSLKLTVRPWK